MKIPWGGFEMNPSPHERKRDRRRDHAAPHDEPVRQPAHRGAPENEAVGRELHEEPLEKEQEVVPDESGLEEHLPAPPPVHPRRRALQPHRVAISDAEDREERGEGVADQGGVEVGEVARAQDDEPGQHGGDQDRPDGRLDLLRAHDSLSGASE